jgi:DNA-directed RNA polymerase subunit RPC12/RpoP
MDQLEKRLEMLDQRLDNIDSIVTALVERVMKQPVTMEVVCPKCGSRMQIMLTSSTKVMSKE